MSEIKWLIADVMSIMDWTRSCWVGTGLVLGLTGVHNALFFECTKLGFWNTQRDACS